MADSYDDGEDEDRQDEQHTPTAVKQHVPLDLRHVISMIDKGHHASDQLLLPSFMYKSGNMVSRLFKPRERSKSLSLHGNNVSDLKKKTNHRLIAELHKYYLRFGQHHERYTELWMLYVSE